MKHFLISALLTISAAAQGTKADYERAMAVSETFSAKKVLNAQLKPHWSGPHHLWYERRLSDGREFVLVDASSGEKQVFTEKPALDKALEGLGERPKEKKLGKFGKGGGGKRGKDSPDRKWRIEVRDGDLYLRALGGNEEAFLLGDAVAADNPFGDTGYWSPDSKWLAAVQRKKVATRQVQYVDSAPKDRLQPKSFTRNYPKPGDELPVETVTVFEVKSGGKVFKVAGDLVKDPFETRAFEWLADSSGFRFEHIERGFGAHRIIELQVPTGKTRAVIDETSETFVHVFGNGFRADLPDSEEIIWRSERDGWNHLYLHNRKTGKVKNQITRGEWVVREVLDIDQQKRQITFTANGREAMDPYFIHYYRIDFDGKGLVRLTDGDGTHKVLWSPDRRWIIDSWSRVDSPPRHSLRKVADGSLVCELETADASALIAAGFPVPERFVAKGRDGKFDIHGIIQRPSNFDPAKKYPVVEVIYAGPHGHFVPKGWRTRYGMWRMQLAELGFVTVQIDGKGTNYRGREFQHFAYKNINDSGFPDRKKWMRSAAKDRPWMDLSRVGIYGGSAGGQSAMAAMLWHGEFYKAASADCGCHDNRMDKIWWNEQWMDYPVGKHYKEQSNMVNAHLLQGKLQLTVGELDTNVDPASTYQVVNALIKADKDFEFIMVPGGGHGIAESKYVARRRMDFFVRSLLGVEPRVE